MKQASATVPMAWRYAGDQVRLWRDGARVSRDALATEAGYSVDYVKSMEYGRRKPTTHLLQVADQMCGAHGKLLAATQFLAPEKYPARSAQYMAAEAEAVAVFWYEVLLIPGLLQHESYVRALMAENCPPLEDTEIESRVRARLDRQEAMKSRRATIYTFVIHEGALRSGIGGPDVMRRQLEHLLVLADLPHVSIQVVPHGRGNGIVLGGPFVLLDNPDHTRYAYIEGQSTSVLHSDADAVLPLVLKQTVINRHTLSATQTASYLGKVASER
ncbi:helix-turn-helix domain-containing protein [Streptomyces sp. CA-253872]|uniref:helix-turn-helix domain-containing protein n=1 Tax=Streptomyces sp. CA-253872 TaxID=3240067 RepID=UPI003D8A1236